MVYDGTILTMYINLWHSYNSVAMARELLCNTQAGTFDVLD